MAMTDGQRARRRTVSRNIPRFLVGGCGVFLILTSLADLHQSTGALVFGLIIVTCSVVAWLTPAR